MAGDLTARGQRVTASGMNAFILEPCVKQPHSYSRWSLVFTPQVPHEMPSPLQEAVLPPESGSGERLGVTPSPVLLNCHRVFCPQLPVHLQGCDLLQVLVHGDTSCP